MTERYDLKALLREIAEDEAVEIESLKEKRVSQEYITKLLARKKKGDQSET